MSALEIYGWVAAAISSVTAFPQLFRILRSRTSAGASLLMWQIMCGVTGSWIVHGIMIGAPNLVVANGIACVAAAVILWAIKRDRDLTWVRTYLVVAGMVALLVTTDVINSVVFGILISAPQLVGGFAQFRDLRRCRDIRGVSVAFLVWNVLVQVIWIVWGFWAGDVPIQIAATSFFVLCALNLVWWTLRRTGAVRAHGLQPEDGLVQAA